MFSKYVKDGKCIKVFFFFEDYDFKNFENIQTLRMQILQEFKSEFSRLGVDRNFTKLFPEGVNLNMGALASVPQILDGQFKEAFDINYLIQFKEIRKIPFRRILRKLVSSAVQGLFDKIESNAAAQIQKQSVPLSFDLSEKLLIHSFYYFTIFEDGHEPKTCPALDLKPVLQTEIFEFMLAKQWPNDQWPNMSVKTFVPDENDNEQTTRYKVFKDIKEFHRSFIAILRNHPEVLLGNLNFKRTNQLSSSYTSNVRNDSDEFSQNDGKRHRVVPICDAGASAEAGGFVPDISPFTSPALP